MDCCPGDACGIEPTSLMQLGRITLFPVKSLDAVNVETARITPGGILDNDRIAA